MPAITSILKNKLRNIIADIPELGTTKTIATTTFLNTEIQVAILEELIKIRELLEKK